MITFQVFLGFFVVVFFFWGGGAAEECLIVVVVKLLTSFEALVLPLKKLTLGVSVVIFDGDSIVQMLEGVGASTVQ